MQSYHQMKMKIQYIISTMEKMKFPTYLRATCCSTEEMMEKAIKILKENPKITQKEFEEMIGINTLLDL